MSGPLSDLYLWFMWFIGWPLQQFSHHQFGQAFILLFVYQFKHLIADYFLQGRYMLGKFAKFPQYILPLLAHVSVHGAMTFVIAVVYLNFKDADDLLNIVACAAFVSILDMVAHFAMDRIKASPKMLGQFKAVSAREMVQIIEDLHYFEQFPDSSTTMQTKAQTFSKIRSNTLFWWSLGLDQMVHHLIHYVIILILVAN